VPIKPDKLPAYMPSLNAVAENTAGIRRAGAASLDLAYVAAGRLDAYWEMGLKPWDMAAGLVLVQEAGGIIGELYGEGDPLATGNVMVATPKIHGALNDVLKAARPAFDAAQAAK
jgi:myo-inositol-1(or 4)-monophosphatase